MKKSVTRIGAAILGLVILFGTMTAMASQLYPDLAPNHWCYKKIMEFVDKGYIDGYEDGTMRPNQTITRAEYVKVVNNFFGFKDGKTDKKFSDISDDAWYAKYVYAAVAQGYISGYEDNTFRPSNPITRQEATVILSRILKIDKEVYPKDHVDGLAQYSDGNEVADWAYTAIHSYSVYNFINGYEDGTLKILQNVTRAETVELLHVLEQKIEIDRPYGRTKTTKMPTINVIVEAGRNEFKPATTVNGWFNNENSCKSDDVDGVYVNITTATDGATIYEKVNPRDPADRNYVTTTVNDFKNMFFLTDGVYDVSAYAKKTGRKTSGTNKVTLKIDTMAPYVEAKVLDNETNPKSNVAHTQKISVTLKDVIPSGLTEDKVSGVNEASAKYTWFIESGEDGFVRVGEWTSLSNGQVVETPTKYGKYKLAVSVKDNAGNSFGDEFDGEIRYDFVEDGETTPSEDIVVEVGNNAPQAEDLVLSTKLGIVASGDIVAFDSDSGDKLTYTMETKPISGEATVDAVTGRVTYTPSEKGTFTFTVKVSDGNESGDTIATVTVTVEDLNYTVNYYLKGTTNKLATSKFVDNQFFSTKILAVNEAIAIDGYNYDSADKEELIIGLNENVINLYYAKRTDLSYTVKYLEKETNKVLAPAKVVENQTFGDKITESAIEIDGYNKIAPTSGEVEITTGTNEITFYYEKRTDLSYTVKYLEKETNKVLAPAKVAPNQTFGDKITETAIEIDGYNKVAPTSGEVEITTGTNEITFYYEKRTDLSYTVKYLEKETNKVLAPAKVVENQTFGDKITESAIEIDGYNKIAPTSGEVEITTGTNEITFYYEKRTDLSYTVNYYLEGTTTKVATSKTVNGRTFEEEVTENAIDVVGYTKVEPTTKTIKISANESENVINFYYTKRTDLSYTVNYYLEGTTTKVATSKTVNGKTFEEEVTENAIDVAGYTKVAPTTKTITISTDESKNVINFYYTKRTDLSYTVNYYLESTTTKVATSKTVNGKTFEEEVTENAIDVAGYTKVAPTTKTIKISANESENVINFYYTKKTDLSYTVNYYLEGTTTKVATSKTVNDKTFEEEVTENAIDVAGYTKVAPTTKTITISADESKNVINFYYKKNEGKLIANIKCNYPTKDGVKAEPGDTLKYKITLGEDGEAVSYPKTISIKLDADIEKPTNLPSNASYDETTHTITWTASTKDDKLTYNVKVKKETPAGSKADTIITGATANGATSVDIEATVAVKVDKNKNVVLVLDVSGSMNACVKHDKFFERKFMSSKIGHYYGLSFEECSEKSRLEVMQEAAKNFTKSIIDERNTEDITITIVTFGDSAVNKGTLKNPTAAQVNAVINKLSANGGTNMRGAIKGATQVLNSSKMLENAVDYVVVLSDGDPEANQYYCDTATLNAFYATKANAYAIGFGNNYKKDELLKIVNNDSSKLFDAADADKLEDAFRKIGSEINKAQTAEGKIDVNVTGIKLYPIKLTYKNKDSETVNVTVKDSSELTSNNLSIVDGKLVWDISKYPGCTGFHVEVNRTKTIATLMLLAEEYGLEDVILVYGDSTITDKLPEEIEDVSGEDEEIIDDTVIGPKQPVSGDTETKILEETSGDTEIKPGKELSGDAEIQPTDETSGDPEKTEVDDKTSGDVEEKTEEVISGDSEIQPTDEASGDLEKTEIDDKTSGDVEEKTEEVISGDTEPKPTEKTSGDSENKTEEKSDDKDIEPTQETSGNVAKEETKQQEKKTEEPKTEENEQQEEKTEEPKAEETEQIEEPKSEETKQQEEKKSEKIIEKEEETKATVEEVVVPEIKDPLENEDKDEKAA